ncbi:MAG: hypothetical protein CL947_02995 [Epsilonproteobacteria bacterium]|nr:hypothetical protein [Campylobacterota bacterium]
MNVASCGRRYLIYISIILFVCNTVSPMVMDNRYFPWIDHFYTGSDSRHSYITAESFFVTGGDAYRIEPRADKNEQIVSYPELLGELTFDRVGESLELAGKTNPIPDDWRWLSDFKSHMCASLEGQGFMISGYAPVTKYFGIGVSTLLMRLNAAVTIAPHQDVITKLSLNVPGNQAQFTEMVHNFYKQVGISCASVREVAAGDTVVYMNLFDVHEYEYKMRKFDWGVWAGIIIPTGLQQDPYNLASIPFGGNGMWGWFVAPRFEIELKEDLTVGMHARVTKRLDKNIQARIPIGKEQYLFAPFVDNVCVHPGTTVSGSLYATFEDLRAGFGIQAKYTAAYHSEDSFRTNAIQSPLEANFCEIKSRSSFVSEYATIRLFYDIGHDKTWHHRPIVSFTWDIPRNHIGGKGFAKTHRVSLGCTVNF